MAMSSSLVTWLCVYIHAEQVIAEIRQVECAQI